MAVEPRFLTLKDVAAYLSVSPTTVRRLVERGEIPEPVRISSRVLRWDKRQLDACFDAHTSAHDDPDELLARWEEEKRKKAARSADR